MAWTQEELQKAKGIISGSNTGSSIVAQKKTGDTWDEFNKKKTEIQSNPSAVHDSLLHNAGQILVGAGKGVASTAVGISELGEKTLGRLVGVYKGGETSASQLIPKNVTEATNNYQKAGKFAEQVAEFAIPATKVSKATKLMPIAEKLGARALISGAVGAAQSGEIGKESGIAAATEIAFPVAGKLLQYPANVLSRLFTGLGSGLSGVSVDTLKNIAGNTKVAESTSKQIIEKGQQTILQKNANSILEGISNIRKQARSMYGKGVEALSKTDIKPEVINKNVSSALEKNGIKIGKNGVDASGSEILDKGIQKKAAGVITEMNGLTNATGKQIRTFLDKLNSLKFKSTGGDPNRLAFNNLMKDLSTGLKKSINESTTKLGEIDAKYSQEMNLAEGMESIFGKVKFKNTTELNRVAKKLEGLFNQKGLDPTTVDDFLTRIGIKPEDFRTSEAVRNIMTKSSGANTKGLSIGEIIQQVTSSVVTPEMVKNIAIGVGKSETFIKSIIDNVAPSARAVIIKSLIGNK